MGKDTKTTNEMANKANGGKGYYLPSTETYEVVDGSSKFTPVYNIDMMGNSGTFTTLEVDGVSVLDDMNLTGKTVPETVRNFTHGKGFTKIKCDVDIWLNRYYTE